MHLNLTKIILLALFFTAVSGLPIVYVKNKNPSTTGPPATTIPKKWSPMLLTDATLPIPFIFRDISKKEGGHERLPPNTSFVKHGQNGWGVNTNDVAQDYLKKLTQGNINGNIVSMNEHLYPTGSIVRKRPGYSLLWDFYQPGTFPPGVTQADVDLIKANAPPAYRSRLPPHGT